MATPKEERDLYEKFSDLYLARSTELVALGQNQQTQAINTLITLALATISLTATLIIGNTTPLSDTSKTLVEYGWVLLGFSIIFGIIQILVDKQQSNWRSEWFNRVAIELHHTARTGGIRAQTQDVLNKKPPTTDVCLFLQATLFIIGLLYILIVAIDLIP